ncbi:MAG: zinc-ribbon domain-containing protein [Oscillospiraceae bacterium]|nr:zinc-ribbon domain-containing protein [Oscillospiraceae bacterium]
MAFCSNCGSELPEGTKFCPACGAPTGGAPQRSAPVAQPEPASRPRRAKKSIFRRWWLWALIAVVAVSLWSRAGGRADKSGSAGRSEPAATSSPRATVRPAAESAVPSAVPEDAASPVGAPGPNEIRPEIKAFLDSYEAFMDEYIAFMGRYASADPGSATSMLAEYAGLLSRYNEFAEKINAMDASEMSQAEWAYYLEVTARVQQKLIAAG